MNPQPDPIIGEFGVLIFSLLVAYFCFTNKQKENSFNISDKFVIGYIEDKKTPNTQPKVPKAPKEKIFDESLLEDCVLALVSVGTKKSQAKKITKEIFEKHNPQTIEDFIRLAYIK